MAQLLGTNVQVPTNVAKGKQFAGLVVAIAVFGLAFAMGTGLAAKATPYVARVPVLGSLMQSSPTGAPQGLFAGIGGQ